MSVSGEGGPGYPPVPASFADDTHGILDEIGTVLQAAEMAVLTNLSDRLQAAESACARLEAKLVGRIELGLDKVEKACAKVRQKILSQLSGGLGAAYESMASLGLPVPEMQEVRYRLASGRVLGPMDLQGAGAEADPRTQGDKGSSFVPVSVPEIARPHNYPVDYTGSVALAADGEIGQRPPVKPVPEEPPIAVQPPPAPQPVPVQPPAPAPFPEVPPPKPIGPPPPAPIQGPDIPVPGGPPPGLIWQCPPGYYPYITPDGQKVCRPFPVAAGPPPIKPSPIPGGGLPPPVPPPGTQPPGPPPIVGDGIDPNTCLYPPSDTTVVGGGECPLPGRPPVPFWLEWWCDVCVIKYQIWQGDTKPSVPSGHVVTGPYNDPPDAAQICKEKCPVKVLPAPGEEAPPEGEKPGEEKPPEEKPEDKPPPKPERPPAPVPPPGQEGQQDDSYCMVLDQALQAVGDAGPNLLKLIGLNADNARELEGIPGLVARAIIGIDEPILVNLSERLRNWLEKVIKEFGKHGDCNPASVIPIWMVQAGLSLLHKYTGIVPEQVAVFYEQLSGRACQSRLPDGGQADMAYLRGTISEKDWKCYHEAAGNIIESARKIMMAGRAKPDPNQLDRLWRRKMLSDDEYKKLMREAGVMTYTDMVNISNLNVQIPTHTEVVSMMKRDVADEKNVNWQKSDETFLDKYQGKVKEWFDANGIPQELAKYLWRAHWHIPSYTMGQQFLFRLRPDKYPAGVSFNKEQFRQMLMQDDWHPEFVDRMIETAYHPVTMMDARRAYMAHASDDDTLEQQLLDLGRKPEVAKFYVKYYKRLREIQDRKQSGSPTLRTLANMYSRCEITNEEFRLQLSKIVFSEEQEKAAVESAVLSRTIWQRKQAINAVRKDFLVGVIDANEAIAALDERQIDPDCINSLIQLWEIERLARNKRATAATLCKWRWYGIITFREQVEALVRNNWTEEDAIRIAEQCTAELSDKARKIAAQAAEKAARELRRRQREAEKARRLAECGPPPCPANRLKPQKPQGDGPQTPVPESSGTGATTPPDQSAPVGQNGTSPNVPK